GELVLSDFADMWKRWWILSLHCNPFHFADHCSFPLSVSVSVRGERELRTDASIERLFRYPDGASYPLILDYSLRTLQCYFRKFLPFSSDTNRYRQWKRTMNSKMKWITMKTQDPH
ncbi:hypothetical protein NPIL_137261, partial [Nephila pilipes]